MSEPMSSGEIEDVLSSIRRLVSEDLRSTARPAFPAASGPAPAAPVLPPKLLLTPALRVVPPPEPVPQPQEIAEAEPEEAVEETPAEEIAEAAPEPAPPLRLEVVETAFPEPEVEAWEGEPDPEPEFEPPPVLDPRVASIGARMARRDTAWEAETGDPPLTRLSWIEVAERREEEEARAMPFVHRPSVPETRPPETRAEEPALIATTDEVLDEAVLREIVREVLREELQGHLGERITRNIRKLVRAEVHRSLTLRDYE